MNLHPLIAKSLKLLRIARRPFTLRALECACVVDIGANRGQFALVSRLVWPQAQIYSFEPLPGPAAVFYKAFKNDPRVKLPLRRRPAEGFRCYSYLPSR